jgi:hypothetical protein
MLPGRGSDQVTHVVDAQEVQAGRRLPCADGHAKHDFAVCVGERRRDVLNQADSEPLSVTAVHDLP